MSLFDEIDDMPWAELHHAYGAATDVPGLLKALMTPEAASSEIQRAAQNNKRDVFEQVTWELWGNVFHQGSVWQVTAMTVPFLAEILRDGPDLSDHKLFLIEYLHHLALGYPDDLFPDLPDPDELFAPVAGLQEPGGEPDYAALDNRYLIWMRDSYEAVERHIDVVLPYLDAANDRVAEAAIAFCASFPRCASKSVPLLRRLAAGGDHRAATAAITLAVLEGTDALPLVQPFISSQNRRTAILGACAVLLADSTQISSTIVARLTKPFDGLDEAGSAHAGKLNILVGRCLMRIGPQHRDRAVAALCQQLASAKPMESLSLTQSLLFLVFDNKPPPSMSKQLSPLQRKALEAIKDHGSFQVAGGIFANYGNLLANWGLPQSADDMEKWLSMC